MSEKNLRMDTVTSYTDEEVQRIFEYWTPEKMKNAEPVDLVSLNDKNVAKYKDGNDKTDSKSFLGTPFEPDVSKLPYHCAGVIFATDKNGKNHWGTAQFVAHCRMLLTAAHVLADDDGKLSNNIQFMSYYGTPEQKAYGIKRLKIHPKWQGSQTTLDIAYDYGFCYTTEPSPHQDYMLLKMENPTQPEIQAIGYPENYGEGKKMYAVNGTWKINSEYPGMYMMQGNPMSHGASGGAWISEISSEIKGLKNLVTGINCRLMDEVGPETIASPLFDRQTADLFNEVLDFGSIPPEERTCKPILYQADNSKFNFESVN